ncbi:p21-C-terminal region-binding protein-domain-containing protein [Emericellopsis atlantica]|uniref:Protein BCP1 n=1 Tax=Emericellopsis atlantica TaxID=2614577 RepID=A0A9P8CNC9_9HYPO|nr:p21-C-terminal region-binding protein-domain-containing protein [Emericellopsis atlantica]KAG9253393.1 p21-C-terminal region-binding protein-domain-containing protein [Emericellopsis atlantica]
MGKKRSRELDGKDPVEADPNVDKMDEDDEEDFDVVNVDFEWFNFDNDIDFEGTKGLLRQLFDVDANLFNMSALTDLILSQPTIGSTVKVDGKSTDAYALCTVLNLAEHAQKEPIEAISKYLAQKARTNESLSAIPPLIEGKKQVGLVFSERLINVPGEIAPPLHSMLIDEVGAAVEDKEPYEFTHYLILSKTYQEVESVLDVEDRKKKKAKEQASVYPFHPEDEVFQRYATAYGSFEYTKQDEAVADSKRAFQEMGIKTFGHMILIEASKYPEAVEAVKKYLSPPS